MTKCVKPLSDLATLRAQSSRPTDQDRQFGQLSTQSRSVAKGSDAPRHACCSPHHRMPLDSSIMGSE